VQHAVPLADLSHYLDQFCTGLWRAARDAGMAPEQPTRTNAYVSRWATVEQRGVIVALRQQLGILDSSDLPDQLEFTQAVRLIEHLQIELGGG
jgi:hypothetical protein